MSDKSLRSNETVRILEDVKSFIDTQVRKEMERDTMLVYGKVKIMLIRPAIGNNWFSVNKKEFDFL